MLEADLEGRSLRGRLTLLRNEISFLLDCVFDEILKIRGFFRSFFQLNNSKRHFFRSLFPEFTLETSHYIRMLLESIAHV